jgi:hypothetical protein
MGAAMYLTIAILALAVVVAVSLKIHYSQPPTPVHGAGPGNHAPHVAAASVVGSCTTLCNKKPAHHDGGRVPRRVLEGARRCYLKKFPKFEGRFAPAGAPKKPRPGWVRILIVGSFFEDVVDDP